VVLYTGAICGGVLLLIVLVAVADKCSASLHCRWNHFNFLLPNFILYKWFYFSSSCQKN